MWLQEGLKSEGFSQSLVKKKNGRGRLRPSSCNLESAGYACNRRNDESACILHVRGPRLSIREAELAHYTILPADSFFNSVFSFDLYNNTVKKGGQILQ